jgi:hypothetical protein
MFTREEIMAKTLNHIAELRMFAMLRQCCGYWETAVEYANLRVVAQ